MSSSPLHRLLALAGALVALAIAAPAASADSIAYVKGGDVWLSTGDGSRQYRVTSTGGYSDVSQADDGTMIALHGVRLHRLDRRGRVLADFATPVSDTRPAGSRVFFGPYDPAISPDGTKVAYTYYYMTQTQDPSCYPPECEIAINEGGTGYSHADRLTGWDEPGFRKHSGWRNPSWVDDRTLMLSDPTHLPNHDVVIDVPQGTSVGLVRNWFSDTVEGNPHVAGGDITRDRTKMAFATGSNDSTLSVYSVPSFPTSWRDSEPNAGSKPLICYRYSGPTGGSYSTPTFSPDGTRVAWAEGDGIKVVNVPSFAGGCTVDGASPNASMLVPGGSQPDWGPAGVPAAAMTATAGRPKLRRALARGLTVRVSVPSAGRVRATATRGGRKVASASKRVSAGTARVKLRFTAAARRSLRRAPAVRLRVKVAYTPRGGATQRGTLAVKLSR
jgi:WD40-like Beta Propeller Repeat